MNIEAIEIDQIGILEPLWKKLNELHLESSVNFKDHFRNNSFHNRWESLSSFSASHLRIYVLYDDVIPVGYCISTLNDSMGEIESLYLEEDYRKNGYGNELVDRSLEWLKSNGCNKIVVSVAAGNTSVLPFYEKFGFSPRKIVLEQV